MTIMPVFAFSQTKLNKIYKVEKGQQLALKFDYPQLIHVSTWDKNEVSVEAVVTINGGKNDGAFTLEQSNQDGKISISNKINMSEIPDVYFVVADGVKTRFENKEDFENFKKGKTYSVSYQKDIQVIIQVKLPANISTEVTSIYGTVELENVNGPIRVDARYGKVDASLDVSKIGKIKLTNHFGKIYSDLQLKPTEQTEKNFYTSITATPGRGPTYDINASYGNIYLRKNTK